MRRADSSTRQLLVGLSGPPRAMLVWVPQLMLLISVRNSELEPTAAPVCVRTLLCTRFTPAVVPCPLLKYESVVNGARMVLVPSRKPMLLRSSARLPLLICGIVGFWTNG